MRKYTKLFTPSVADGYTIPGLPDAGLGDDRVRLHVDPDAPVSWTSDDWQRVDTDHGVFEVRRADCGAGCRCAAEIRPVTVKVRVVTLTVDEQWLNAINEMGSYVESGEVFVWEHVSGPIDFEIEEGE